MSQELTLVRPDDWHLHVRDGAALRAVVPHSARQFGRAIVMPNLRPPVVTVEQALAYRDRVIFMDKGAIVEDATKDDFFGKPRSERAQVFLSKILHH